MNNSEIEQKSFINELIKRFKRILNLSGFQMTINDAISEQYVNAIKEVDDDLKLPINLVPKPKDLNFLQNYVKENIDAASDDIGNNLRQEIQRGILNGETKTQLVSRVKSLFKDKKYQTRLKTILRTETLRANNQGTFEGATQAVASGVKLEKWLDVILDDRTSKICKAEHTKYGTPDKSIPLDQDFVVKVDNKTYKSKVPPFHVNCRTVLRIRRIK